MDETISAWIRASGMDPYFSVDWRAVRAGLNSSLVGQSNPPLKATAGISANRTGHRLARLRSQQSGQYVLGRAAGWIR